MRSTSPSSALRQLVAANARELFRDGKTVFFTVLFPLLFLAMFLGIGQLNTGGSYRVAVAASPQQQQIMERVSAASGFTAERWTGPAAAEPAQLGGYDALVQAAGGRATVTIDSAKFGAMGALRDALEDSGIAPSGAVFRTPDGGVPFDPVKASLPTALLMALMSVAFFGTATPLISLRQRGTLRLLGTTPLRRLTFVVAQAPVRLALVAGQLVLLGGVAGWLGFLSAADAFLLFATGMLGALMLFAFGYLAAARLRNPEVANGALAVLMPLVLLLGGLFIPLGMLPDALRTVSDAMPTTYLVDALSHQLTGAPSTHGLAVDWLVLTFATLIFGGLAAGLFRWDQGEER